MLRAAAEPERFLSRGFARLLARHAGALRRPRSERARAVDLKIALPPDLALFLQALGGASIAGLVPRARLPRWPSLLSSARSNPASLARLIALLSSAVPFGVTDDGELVVYLLADTPARGVIAIVDPDGHTARPFCRGAAELSASVSLHAFGAEYEVRPFSLAEEEAVRARFARGRAVAALLLGSDAQLRTAIRALDRKPLDVPLPEPQRTGARAKASERYAPLALGALVEAFFREPSEAVEAHLSAHAESSDELVRSACEALGRARRADRRPQTRGGPANDLARRRRLALRALASGRRSRESAGTPEATRRIIAHIDGLAPSAESRSAAHEREEALLALDTLGDRRVAPELFDRAITGDSAAIEMLAALGDRAAVRRLLESGARTPGRDRPYEIALVRALAAVDARDAAPALRRLLDDNPLTGWREGLERGHLVRELIVALGKLGDVTSAERLVAVLESSSQEYRAVIPAAAHALGRLHYAPALSSLERLLASPKEPVRCEAVWAVGAIGRAHPREGARAAALLDGLTGLEPGVEATRLAALSTLRAGKKSPKSVELRRALQRALWEPAFRQEETSRRRVWALRALEDLASMPRADRASAKGEALAPFLGHESVRYLLTRDDHRVRRAARRAFAAWRLALPTIRPYFSFALASLEARGLDALHEAVRDPLGIFRYNVAERLGTIGDPRSVRPLAEATAQVLAEPPTSTYEYDDAPPHLVAFVRALAKMNAREGNDVLIEALRSNHHQVRAVVAEHAPRDERFIPELMAMLQDPRSFLRARAEKSLIALGVLPSAIDQGTVEVPAVTRFVGA